MIATARTWLRRVQVMVVKELLQLARDPLLLAFLLFAFTADVYMAASGVRLSLRHAPLLVLDHDRSAASRELVHRFQEPHFTFLGQAASPEAARRALDDGSAMVLLDIPPDFAERLGRGRQAPVQLQVDASNTVLGLLASDYASRIVAEFGRDWTAERLARTGGFGGPLPRVEVDQRVWFNPNQRHPWFMALSELTTIITLFAILLPATALVREKERGTVEQLIVSPLTPLQVMLPKVAAMTGVILAATLLSLYAVVFPFFDVPLRGSLLLFVTVTALYVFTSAGLGLFAATMTRNLAQVGMATLLIVAPMLFLSGTWTPPEAMPQLLRIATNVSPLHHYLDLTFGIFLKGAGVRLLWDSILALALLGGSVFGFGVWRFNRQFE